MILSVFEMLCFLSKGKHFVDKIATIGSSYYAILPIKVVKIIMS